MNNQEWYNYNLKSKKVCQDQELKQSKPNPVLKTNMGYDGNYAYTFYKVCVL